MSEELEAAVDGGMEPESPTGADPTPVESDDDGDDFESSAPADPHSIRRGRNVSEKTRELFAKAAADIKRQQEDTAGEGAFGEYDEGYTAPAPKQAPAAAMPVPAAPLAPTVAQPATVPPAPSLDPSVLELRERLTAKEAQLVERESALTAREAASDIEKHRDAYIDRGAGAIVDLIKSWNGEMTPEDFQSEIADLITGLSSGVLGVQLPADVRAQMESRRAVKTVRAHTAKLSKREAEIEAKQRAATEADTRVRAIHALGGELAKPEVSAQFKFLAAEDNAAEIIFDVVESQLKRDGTMLQWTEAAKRANEYLETKWRAAYDKRASLLSTSPAPAGDAANSKTERVQGDPQGIRRSHTLTNAATASAPAPAEPAKPGRWTREDHRANTMRKFRAAFSAPDEK